MEIVETFQTSFDEVKSINFDYLIAASGYESRACYISNQLMAKTKLAFGFKDRKQAFREDNDAEFTRLKFDLDADISHADGFLIGERLADKICNSEKQITRVAIDYSCMPKTWYSAIIRALCLRRSNANPIDVYFLYSPAKFKAPGPAGINTVVEPLHGYCNIEAPKLPTALLLGLGYEPVRALGLRDYIDPTVTYGFYTDPAIESAFTAAVLKNNDGLLQTIGPERSFRYALSDLDYTSALLTHLVRSLSEEYRVIVAPLGPKPFCLLTLILAQRYPLCDVWRVSAGESGPVTVRDAVGSVLSYRVRFQ